MQYKFKLLKLHCAGCALALEQKLNSIVGVGAEISFVTKVLKLEIERENQAEVLTEVNKECYKFIGRVLYNNNLRSLAKVYLDKYKDVVYYDPELHFIYAKYYLEEQQYKLALASINQCLLVLPEYFPAKKLKEEIISYLISLQS